VIRQLLLLVETHKLQQIADFDIFSTAPQKNAKKPSLGYAHEKAAQRPTVDQVVRLVITNLAWYRLNLEPRKQC